MTMMMTMMMLMEMVLTIEASALFTLGPVSCHLPALRHFVLNNRDFVLNNRAILFSIIVMMMTMHDISPNYD